MFRRLMGPSGYVCHTTHISMAYSYSATAPMIQIRWAETDLPSFATHPLYPGANPTNHELRGAAIGPKPTAGGLVARQASFGFGDGGGGGFSLESTVSSTSILPHLFRPPLQWMV